LQINDGTERIALQYCGGFVWGIGEVMV